MSVSKDLVNIIKGSDDKGTKPYDTTATVTRVEDSTVWVHIPGGVDETPVKKTINAKQGDTVQVRVSGGSAWLNGNASAPPTDDTQAKLATEYALVANNAADSAVKSSKIASEAAADAQTSAANALTEANNAQTSAQSAYDSATTAIDQLSVVENIVGVLDLIASNGVYQITQDNEPLPSKWYFTVTGTAVASPTGDPHANGWYELDNGIYTLTEDTTVQVGTTYYTITASVVTVGYDYILTRDADIVDGKTYYTRSGSGTDLDPYVYTEVQNPDVAYISTYYEYTNSPTMHEYYELVSIDEAIQNYVSSHLVLIGDSLFLQTDEGNGSTRLELNTTNGMILYDQNGNIIAQYGSNVTIGDADSFHVQITNNRLSFYRDSENEVAYISGDKLYITQSVVLQNMDLGTPVADGGLGQWSWQVHQVAGANNLYLKWLG